MWDPPVVLFEAPLKNSRHRCMLEYWFCQLNHHIMKVFAFMLIAAGCFHVVCFSFWYCRSKTFESKGRFVFLWTYRFYSVYSLLSSAWCRRQVSLVIQLHSHTAKLGSRLHRFVWSSISYVFANYNNHNEYLLIFAMRLQILQFWISQL